jgi:bacterioferritin
MTLRWSCNALAATDGSDGGSPLLQSKTRPSEVDAAMKQPFKTDIESIRQRAREQMANGAVTVANRTDVQQVIDVLNEVLATEVVCTLRYRNHYYMAQGLDSAAVAEEFLQHAGEEQQHADWVSARIVQLGGNPNLNPAGLATRSHSLYEEGGSLEEMLKEDLVAERIAIETYSEIIRWLGDDDPTSRQLMIDILKTEEEHAEDLFSLLGRLLRKDGAQAGRR